MAKDKSYYECLYLHRIDELDKEMKDVCGDSYDGTQTAVEFDQTANAEEIAGYYIYHYKENALRQWLDNIYGLNLTEMDEEVTKILKGL